MTISEKLKKIAENMPEVYNGGIDEGYEKGFEDGLKYGGGEVDLSNYYTKAETDIAIANAPNLKRKIVSELPNVGDDNTIYMVLSENGSENNIYLEYMYLNGAWELIGSTQVDLTDYVKNTDYSTQAKGGVVKIHNGYGMAIGSQGTIYPLKATQEHIDSRSNDYNPIVSSNLEYAVKSVGDGYYAKSVKGEQGQVVSFDGDGNFVSMPLSAVSYEEQTLTDEQKSQARVNIGAASADEIDGINSALGVVTETKSGKILTVEARESSNIKVQLIKEGVSDYSGVSVNVGGANLLKFPYWYMYNNWVEQGVSFTVDATTSKIHASGTATANGSIRLWRSTDNFTLPKGVYKLSHIHEGEADITTLYFAINVYVNGSLVRTYSTDEERHTVMDLSEYDNPILEARILFKTGVVFDDDIYPMINVGDTALPWEAYVSPTTYTVESDGTANVVAIAPYTTMYADDESYTVSITTVSSSKLWERIDAIEKLNTWTDKKWCACGDSITYPSTGITRYYDIAHEEYGIEVVTEAVGGSGYFAAGVNALINRIENVPNDADVITILCGINDVYAIASGKLTIGNVSDSAENTFCGCVNSTLNKLFAKNVDANVGIISPIITISGETYPTDIQKSVNTALREICESRSIPFLDLYHGSGMRPDEEAFRSKYYSSHDGLHPNTRGHARIYPKILQFVKTLLPLNR